jgi:hypothetical protein
VSVAVYAVGSGAGLGAWTLDLTVDPQAVRVVGCSVPAGGVCNVAYGPGQVRVAGASAAGVPADQPLVVLEVLPRGSVNSTLVTASAITAADAGGNPVLVLGASSNVLLRPSRWLQGEARSLVERR